MKLSCKATGFTQGVNLFEAAALSYEPELQKALTDFGEAAKRDLQRTIKSDKVTPRKEHPDGKPTLFDSGKYVESYQVHTPAPRKLTIGPEGQNDNMSNAELGDKLEYGDESIKARPHQRPWREKVKAMAARNVGKRVVNAVLGSK